MNKNLKNALDVARAAVQNIRKQHATAEANRDKINTQRPVLQMKLKAAADRLEQAQLWNLRGVIADSEIDSARTEYEEAREALVRQNENEGLAARAMDVSHEHGLAIEALGIAREKYFGEIRERIEKTLQTDAKQSGRLISVLSSSFCIGGRSPEWGNPFDSSATWVSILLACFPIPSVEEVDAGHAEFVKTYDAN